MTHTIKEITRMSNEEFIVFVNRKESHLITEKRAG